MHRAIITATVGFGLLFASTGGAASGAQRQGGGDVRGAVITSLGNQPVAGVRSYVAKRHTRLPAGITMQALRLRAQSVWRTTCPPGGCGARTHPRQPCPQGGCDIRAHNGVYGAESSSNWGGWIDTARGRNAFYSVTSTFRVPTVNVLQTTDGPAGNMAAQWAGLDGAVASSSSVEQTGVCEWVDSELGIPHYVAWWEMLPDPMHAFGDVHPGDLMRATVRWYGPSVQSGFIITLSDVTQGYFGAKAERFKYITPLRNSAEVITELPSSSDGPMALTNYGNVRYSQSKVATASKVGYGISTHFRYRAQRAILTDDTGAPMLTVSQLTSNGTAFSTPFVEGGW